MLGCPLGGVQIDLGEKAGILLNSFVGSSLKYHFVLMRLQNLLKSVRNSGSLILFCIGAKFKFNPFSKTLISVSVRIFLLKLNTASEQKCTSILDS